MAEESDRVKRLRSRVSTARHFANLARLLHDTLPEADWRELHELATARQDAAAALLAHGQMMAAVSDASPHRAYIAESLWAAMFPDRIPDGGRRLSLAVTVVGGGAATEAERAARQAAWSAWDDSDGRAMAAAPPHARLAFSRLQLAHATAEAGLLSLEGQLAAARRADPPRPETVAGLEARLQAEQGYLAAYLAAMGALLGVPRP